jgi:pimeloyl-ACP methyl ester carboxylesterase
LPQEPVLEGLARRFRVYAPEWPGYGADAGEEKLDDMLDFALHGWDVIEALGLDARPSLIGHSMGGMIAAEMACVAPREVGKLALVSPAGLWLDEHPVPDIFAMLPGQLAEVLFADPAAGAALLTGGADLSNMDALKEFYLGTQRRLAMAGKILFPIPNRRLSKRLYRLTADTLLLWGSADRLIVPAYARQWQALVPVARLEIVAGAGHMLPWEQPEAFVKALAGFLG